MDQVSQFKTGRWSERLHAGEAHESQNRNCTGTGGNRL
jgi:hypothetical protein